LGKLNTSVACFFSFPTTDEGKGVEPQKRKQVERTTTARTSLPQERNDYAAARVA
jgi:hypothetical protein